MPDNYQQNCPLCNSNKNHLFSEDKFRKYFKCSVCSLVFADVYSRIPLKMEKERYLQHNNNASDEKYIKFLNRIVLSVKDIVPINKKGLDYGAGPTPVLTKIFKNEGYEMIHFDPFFHPENNIFKEKFDFITLCEVVEHMHNPSEEFEILFNLLNKGGKLFIMTSLLPSKIDFSSWYYKNDITHVCFFSSETFKYIAGFYNMDLEINENVAIFKGPSIN